MSITSLRNGSPAVAGGVTPHAPPARPAGARVDLTVLLGRLPLVGLLAVQAAIGYEWFMSGLTKIARGGFPAGLADELREKSVGAPGWYRTVIDDVLIPNGQTVGYLTEIGELVVGLVLIGAAAAFILAPDRLSRATRDALFGSTAISTFPALRRLRALPGAGSRTAAYETR